jgi:hypothetical protein
MILGIAKESPKQASEQRSFGGESWTMSYTARSLRIVFTQIRRPTR